MVFLHFYALQDLSSQLGSLADIYLDYPSNSKRSDVSASLLARVYLKLGTWQRILTPALDDTSIEGCNEFFSLQNFFIHMYFFIVEILRSLKSATECAPSWGKAWHTWALFNTAAMAHYAFRCNSIVEQYVVSAVSGYFHSIASAATSKGVDDSLQVSQSHFLL